ncbi:hypothetical protein ACNKHX_13415 [Shigella flexneri]
MLILVRPAGLANSSAKWVNPGATPDSRYGALFAPIGVGVMQYFDLLRAHLAR